MAVLFSQQFMSSHHFSDPSERSFSDHRVSSRTEASLCQDSCAFGLQAAPSLSFIAYHCYACSLNSNLDYSHLQRHRVDHRYLVDLDLQRSEAESSLENAVVGNAACFD